MPIVIRSPLDNGNIIEVTQSSNVVELEIRGDSNYSKWFQWFNFTAQFDEENTYLLKIINANEVKYPEWNKYEPYEVYVSYNGIDWFNAPTHYDETTGHLNIHFKPEKGQTHAQFAFFPPFTYQAHLDLIERAKQIPHCEVNVLGKTSVEADGRDITLLTFGQPSAEKQEIWVIGRQHPGEPQAEWYIQGLINYLKNNQTLLEKYTFRIVPNMNPDGTYLGNLRTNRYGKDLNREWLNPSLLTSPEVYLVFNKMLETGVHFFMDVHSDEIIPKPFLDESHLSLPEERQNSLLEDQERTFMNFYMQHPSGMQNVFNYGEKDRADSVNLTLAAMRVGDYFNCPAFTLEMPTKQWSIEQCYQLSHDFIPTLQSFHNQLQLQKEGYQKNSLFTPGDLLETNSVETGIVMEFNNS